MILTLDKRSCLLVSNLTTKPPALYPIPKYGRVHSCSQRHKANLNLLVPLALFAVIATTPVTVTEDARYERHIGGLSQAASISNSYLNPVSTSNTNNNMISNLVMNTNPVKNAIVD